MAKFIKAPDIWNMTDAERATLQPGQWIKCGESGMLSRFYHFNPATGHVTAFHGPRATRKMREYVKAGSAAAVRGRVMRAIRLGQVPPYAKAEWRGDELANRGPLPIWSGELPPPPIGAVVELSGLNRVQAVVTGYEIDGRWLMAKGHRLGDTSRRGNIAGAEIIARK
jgi:hypothetical protein